MEEKSLKIVGADKTFFGRLTNTLTKMILPTKLGLNGIIISMKRSAMLKAYASLEEQENNPEKSESLSKKFESAYAGYLETIDKFIMDSVYKKVKNRTASQFEENALSKYYTVTSLKENQYAEYKYRKQKYLLELDYSGLESGKKDKVFSKYKVFYYKTMESLYKGILKNYSIQIANASESNKNVIYKKIFETIEDYLENILPIKIEIEQNVDKEVVALYNNFMTFKSIRLEQKEKIEKQMILLSISRKLFTHSLPLIVAEQCYYKLIKDLRDLIITSPNKKKEEVAYSMQMKLMEEFYINLLSTKIYWDNSEERNEFKEFWDKYKKLEKNEDFEKEKQTLFIRKELKELNKEKDKNTKIIAFYKNKLVEFGKIRRIKNSAKTEEHLMKPKAYEKFKQIEEDKRAFQKELLEEIENQDEEEIVVETKIKKRGRPKKVKIENE